MGYLIDADTEERLAIDRLPTPIFVHGQDGSGASYAAVIMTAELVRSEQPTVFMCARATAVRTLQDELAWKGPPDVHASVVGPQTAAPLEASRLVSIHGTAPFLLNSLRALGQWQTRWVVLKNVESTLNFAFWETLQTHPQTILSGDFSRLMVDIPSNYVRTVFCFSRPPAPWNLSYDEAPRYVGRMYQSGNFIRRVMCIDRPVKNPAQDA